MKKGFCKITVLLVMLFALTACGAQPLPEQFEEDTVREAAEQAISFFNEKDYQSIIEMGNDDFQRVLKEEEFASQSDPYLDKCGAFQEISKTIFVGNIDEETQAAYKYADRRHMAVLLWSEAMRRGQYSLRLPLMKTWSWCNF